MADAAAEVVERSHINRLTAAVASIAVYIKIDPAPMEGVG